MARISFQEDPMSHTRQVMIQIERQLDAADEKSIFRRAIQEAVNKLAADWVENNRDKLYERLNVDAIANMMMIEAAKEIKKNMKDDDNDDRHQP